MVIQTINTNTITDNNELFFKIIHHNLLNPTKSNETDKNK